MPILSSETSARISIGALVTVFLSIISGTFLVSSKINEIETLKTDVNDLKERLKISNNNIDFLRCKDRETGERIKPFFEHVVYIFLSEFNRIDQNKNSMDSYRIDGSNIGKLMESVARAKSSNCNLQQ
jgi:hypothetical protein